MRLTFTHCQELTEVGGHVRLPGHYAVHVAVVQTAEHLSFSFPPPPPLFIA